MYYHVFYKGHSYKFDFDTRYDPMDFVRNNDGIDFFKIENGEPKINMELVVELMIECYKDMLETNYL